MNGTPVHAGSPLDSTYNDYFDKLEKRITESVKLQDNLDGTKDQDKEISSNNSLTSNGNNLSVNNTANRPIGTHNQVKDEGHSMAQHTQTTQSGESHYQSGHQKEVVRHSTIDSNSSNQHNAPHPQPQQQQQQPHTHTQQQPKPVQRPNPQQQHIQPQQKQEKEKEQQQSTDVYATNKASSNMSGQTSSDVEYKEVEYKKVTTQTQSSSEQINSNNANANANANKSISSSSSTDSNTSDTSTNQVKSSNQTPPASSKSVASKYYPNATVVSKQAEQIKKQSTGTY
mmetsp:Transcript_76648/g.165841  ORF Transcript_76648/g.165841 Transcript_76648/m.165841 type:complete len:285 (+) Transcript_76648:875-1729(+)